MTDPSIKISIINQLQIQSSINPSNHFWPINQSNIQSINPSNHLGEHEKVSERADDESRGNARHDEAYEVGPARGALLLEGGDSCDEAPDNKDMHSWIYFIWLMASAQARRYTLFTSRLSITIFL